MAVDSSQALLKEIRDTPGKWLYHYTSMETAFVHILPTCRLRLSPFSRMRDPREYKQWFPGALGYYEGNVDALMPNYTEASLRLNLLRDEFKLLSLTLDRDDTEEGACGRGFARSRLWELYAGRGSGVCLVLRKSEAVGANRGATREARPRRARSSALQERPDAHERHVLVRGTVRRRRQRDRGSNRRAIPRQALSTKNSEWESEHEYRFIVRSPAEYEYVDISGALTAACRSPESVADAEHALHYFAKELGIAIGYLEWNHNDPILLGRPLDA